MTKHSIAKERFVCAMLQNWDNGLICSLGQGLNSHIVLIDTSKTY